jgi:uncharacterized protein
MTELAPDKQFFPEDVAPEAPLVNEAILKVHSRCNLDCDYCYVYNLGDDSWREQPKLMSDETVDAFGERLAEYLHETNPLSFQVTFHGGEPLLASPDFFARTVSNLRQTVGTKTALQFAMQTNGTLLTDEYLKVFRKHRVYLGVSLDGPPSANMHRLNHAGKQTHDETVAGIQRMTEDERYRRLFQGILSVVDIENDPVETYAYLKDLNPPAIDFLLPHGNWQDLPKGLDTLEGRMSRPYAQWLGAVFNEWFPGDTMAVRVRTFDSMIHLLGNGRSNVESLGGESGASLVVVETDGSYELVDTLKSTPGRVSKIGKNVYKHSIHETSAYMAKRSKQLGTTVLTQECETCPVKKQCGGGYAPHRYSKEKGFDNRSVFCFDLADMISSVHGALMKHAVVRRVMNNSEAAEVVHFPDYGDSVVARLSEAFDLRPLS